MEKSKWADTTERYICFLDIMGFKDRVMRNNHIAVVQEIESFFDDIINQNNLINEMNTEPEWQKVFKDREIKIVTFSDSILLISKGNNIRDLTLLILLTKLVLSRSYKQKLPIKGAIAKGQFTANFKKNIFIGQPLIDAYLLQEELLYYGIVCTGEVEKDIDENGATEQYEKLIYQGQTPFKSGKIQCTNVSPKDNELIDSDLKSLYYSVNGKPRVYVDNTIEMYEKIKTILNTIS